MTPEFGPVRELFGELVDSGREIGAGLSIWKGGTTLRQVLSHTAGQPAFPESARGLDLLDAGGLIRALEESAPIAEP
ncbi:MAG: hypothetical protein ACXWXV_07325, partial [Aeromicrobium sp.]